jgi:hypothetical protein
VQDDARRVDRPAELRRRAAHGQPEHAGNELAGIDPGGDLLAGLRERLARGADGRRARQPCDRLHAQQLVDGWQLTELDP